MYNIVQDLLQKTGETFNTVIAISISIYEAGWGRDAHHNISYRSIHHFLLLTIGVVGEMIKKKNKKPYFLWVVYGKGLFKK